jgi:hypothetical protein
LRPRPPAGNRVILLHRLYRDGGPEARWDREIGRGGAFRFQPAGPGSAPWRTLTVLVTPERIEARWGADGERVGDLWSADLRSKTRAALDGLRKSHPADPSLEGVDPACPPRGPLGLYVLNGSASFRNVTVAPLGEAD